MKEESHCHFLTVSKPYLKIPVEASLFALRERRTTELMIYLAGAWLWSGKVRINKSCYQDLSKLTGLSEGFIYKKINWLVKRDWIVKNEKDHWLFFRGIDQIHKIEGWIFARSTIFQVKDFKNFKAYSMGAFLGSLVRSTKRGKQTGHRTRHSKRPKTLFSPVSLKSISEILGVSESTAYRLRKLAEKCEYIKNEEYLVRVTNLDPKYLKHLRYSDSQHFEVKLFGFPDKKKVSITRLKQVRGNVFLQEPNLITPLIPFKNRKGLSNFGQIAAVAST